MNVFRKKININDFKKGQILKFNPGYHTSKPYYAEVVDVGSDGITTSIPGHHKLNIRKSINWNYHIKRITIIGDKNKFGNLLFDQIF